MVRTTVLGQVADVDVRLLRGFRAVAESGGLAAAEREGFFEEGVDEVVV